MKKRILALIATGVLSAGAVGAFAGCGGDDTIKLTVWGSAAQEATFKEMVEEFKAANPDKKYDIKVGISEEDMVAGKITTDPDAAADVYCYSNDQLIPLLRVGALARIGGTYLDAVKSANSEDSVKSGSIEYGTADEKVYGYPYASDNAYFMYYDKSVISESEVATLESIISVCEGANKKIAWALDVPWYTAGFFFTFGCTYNVEHDYSENYTEKNISIDFNNEGGIKASKAMAKLANSSAFAGKGTDDEKITTGFSTHTTAVAVSGTWNAKKIKEALGDNYGVCKLPTVNVDGTDTQMYSFKGYKLMGVNPHCENLPEAHKLAQFLTGQEMQKKRFDKHIIGPTNKTVAELSEVKNEVTFAALNAQLAFAKDQTSVPSNFWEPLKGYGLNIMDKTLLVESNPGPNQYTYQERLDAMVAQITNK